MQINLAGDCKYHPSSSNSIELEITKGYPNVIMENNEIVKIKFNDSIIGIGDKIDYSVKYNDNDYKNYFVINKINPTTRDNIFEFREFRKNKTHQYLYPLAGIKRDDVTYNFCINSYIDNDKDFIYLVFRYHPFEWYLEMKNKILIKSFDYIKTLKSVDDRFDIFQYAINPEFKQDINNFLEGQYHLFSKKLKTKITNYFQLTAQCRKYKILYNDPTLRNELSQMYHGGVTIPQKIGLDDKPVFEREILQLQDNLISL